MIYGLYNSAAGMMVNEYRQNVISNNLANAETTGFKRDVAVFAERTPASLAGVRRGASQRDLQAMSGGMWLGRTFTDHSEGTKVLTDNELDITLEGPGFLAVNQGGQVAYTRDGRLMMDADGQLVSVVDGASVLARGGAPVMLNRLGGQPEIDTDGRVSQDGNVVATLEIVDFENHAAMKKVGDNRFAAPADLAVPSPALVRSGYTESSGVEPVKELVGMIEASRAYQLNAEMLKMQDTSVGQLINVIARG